MAKKRAEISLAVVVIGALGTIGKKAMEGLEQIGLNKKLRKKVAKKIVKENGKGKQGVVFYEI